jgi:L-lactate dehydrogenase complex protein LldG
VSSAREEILARILQATEDVSGRGPSDREADYAAIQRAYVQHGVGDSAQWAEMFADRLQDYGCGVCRCSRGEIAETVGFVLRDRAKRRLLIPAGIPAEWLPNEFEFVRDDSLSNELLDQVEGVLTGCALAIAFTGTILLKHSSHEGRRAATLIPDYHLCIVFEEQVVETVPQGIRAMSAFSDSPITTVSGPSATSDIEMTRINGVHGPRTLDVVLVS